jgi:hypothetical protein
MNRAFRKRFDALTRNASLEHAIQICGAMCRELKAPLSQHEVEIGKSFVLPSPPFFHGGFGGLRAGDVILPPELTGKDPRLLGEDVPFRKSHVYFTNKLDVAHRYASMCENGNVYIVKPVGEINVSPIAVRAYLLMRQYYKRYPETNNHEEFFLECLIMSICVNRRSLKRLFSE